MQETIMNKEKINEETLRNLAERIYDLDAEVYVQLGSSLGRVFNNDRKRCVDDMVSLMLNRPEAHRIRSELALIANMARTIKDKEERALVMREYNIILKELMSLPTSFAGCDIIDPNMARLNTFNLNDRFSKDDHLIICMSWTYGSGGSTVGFKLSDKLKINYYDEEIFDAVLKRLEVEQDSVQDVSGYNTDLPDWNGFVNTLLPDNHISIRERLREFSRYHGLSKRDAVFFNQSDLICDMAKKEDFILMGRCGDVILTNNNIPHISLYVTAPFEQRIQRVMEINKGMDEKKVRHLLHHLDRQHSHYYRFYTGRKWGHANNYDLCVNSASYGIDGTVDFIMKMLGNKAVR